MTQTRKIYDVTSAVTDGTPDDAKKYVVDAVYTYALANDFKTISYITGLLGGERLDDDDAILEVKNILKDDDINVYRERFLHVPLIWACQFGNVDVAKYLVSIGADPRFCDDEAMRMVAFSGGRVNTFKYLLALGCDPHAQNGEALRNARANGYTDIVDEITKRLQN